MRWNFRPWRARSTGRARSCPRPAGRRSTGSGSCPRVELPHREVLEDAPLDLVEAVVVLVEHLPRFRNVDLFCFGNLPRQLGEPLEVGAQHRAFGAALAHALQALELLDGVLVHFLRHAGFVDRLVQLFELGRVVAALAQLLLDLAHLLAQHVLALALVELLLRLLADLLGDAQHADALGEVLEHLVEAALEVEGFEEVLLVLVLDVEQVRDHVGEERRRPPCTTTASSSGALGSSEIASTAWLFSWRKRASTSGLDSSRASTICTRATRNGQPGRNSRRGSGSGPAPRGDACPRRR